MRAQIAAFDEAVRRRFVASKRHTIEVDFHAYRTEIEKERRTRSTAGAPPSRLARGRSVLSRVRTG